MLNLSETSQVSYQNKPEQKPNLDVIGNPKTPETLEQIAAIIKELRAEVLANTNLQELREQHSLLRYGLEMMIPLPACSDPALNDGFVESKANKALRARLMPIWQNLVLIPDRLQAAHKAALKAIGYSQLN